MKNSEKVMFVGVSIGGTTGGGKPMKAKIRFAMDEFRYTKVLSKLGVDTVRWFPLPSPMTKADALQYFVKNVSSEGGEGLFTQQAVGEAIVHATKRILGNSTKK